MKQSVKIVLPEEIPLAQPVPTDNLVEVFRVCTQLEKVCADNDGIGLSATQVGIPWKLFVVMRRENKKVEFDYLVDCEYQGIGPKVKSVEGCLSLRDKAGNLRRFEVERYAQVAVKGKKLVVGDKLELKDMDIILDGLYAVVYQHEIDHNFQRERMVDVIGKEIELYI